MTRSVSSLGLLDTIGEGGAGAGGGARGGGGAGGGARGGGGCWVVDPDANSQTGGSRVQASVQARAAEEAFEVSTP